MLTVEERMEITVLQSMPRASMGLPGPWACRAIRCDAICARVRRRRHASLGPKRPEKLDPFKGYIADRMQAAAPDVIPAAVLLREYPGTRL